MCPLGIAMHALLNTVAQKVILFEAVLHVESCLFRTSAFYFSTDNPLTKSMIELLNFQEVSGPLSLSL